MKEQPITFEVAQLAKEKGFKEYCIAYFSISGEEKYFREDGMYFHSNGANGRLILRPTQSLLQKWLREEHKLHISIYLIESHWEMDVGDCNMNNNVHASPPKESNEYQTYEDALEAGLLECLKLI